MSENDRIILDQILDQQKQQTAPELTPADFFELFSSDQALKDYDLSIDELRSGVTGGGADGGFDGVFVFANGELIQEDADLSSLKRGVQLDLVVIQATTSQGFAESRVERLISTTKDLFDLSRDIGELTSVYKADVLAAAARFRNAYSTLASRFPKVSIRYVIAAKASEVHPNVSRKAQQLQDVVKQLFSAATADVEFLTTSKLLELARREPRVSYELQLAETPISSEGRVGFVCLVRLKDFYSFISEDGQLQRHLFEANVRDYQGSTEVNDEIRASLSAPASEDFWWLNNGVTIVATNAVQSGKTLTIEDPQIVNGLQTSTEIFNHYSSGGSEDDRRTMLVRVIKAIDAASRDRIIKATNSQTYIPPASLRATDKIHRDIEEFLKPRGVYYDRRKNFYKNQGSPVEKIVGIPYMAQAVMAVALRQPNDARARPSSLLKKDDDYRRIFDPARPIAAYYVCAALLKRVEAFLRTNASLTSTNKNNVRFHVAMVVASLLTGKLRPTDADIAAIDLSKAQDDVLAQALALVLEQFESLGATDNIAKGPEFVTRVREVLGQELQA